MTTFGKIIPQVFFRKKNLMKSDETSFFIRFHQIFFLKKINHYSFFYFYQNHFIFSASLEKELSIKTQFASTKIDLTELIAQQNSLYQEKNIDLSTIALCYWIDPFPKGLQLIALQQVVCSFFRS